MMNARTLWPRVLAALVSAAAPASAQIFNVPSALDMRRPIAISGSVGYVQTADRVDGVSGTVWRLGDALQYRAGLEIGMRAGSFGLAYSRAQHDINREGLSAPLNSDGTIRLSQFLATFRSPEVPGAHQIVELSSGLAQWGNYQGSDVLSGEEAKTQNAWALQIGYGFGFTVGDRASITLIQDFAMLIGSKDGLESGQSRSVRQSVTRLGVRWRFRGRM
ncbi:MAG: hypothetical protein ACKVS7_02875 [Gemmatimonadaceae bacterium]